MLKKATKCIVPKLKELSSGKISLIITLYYS